MEENDFAHTFKITFRRLWTPTTPLHVPKSFLWPIFTCMANGAKVQPIMMQLHYQVSPIKIISHKLILVHSSKARDSVTLLSDVEQDPQPHLITCSSWEQNMSEEIPLDSSCDSTKIFREKDDKETLRRRKIGIANKGRIPWNKGKKHSLETRELIKQRTIEALRDPKVKKKMCESSHAHSEQTKAKIGFSQRRIWEERLKCKRLKEKLYQTWAKIIAEAAKRGGKDQQELDWDSYNKLQALIAVQQLRQAADKTKAKQVAKLRAELAAKARAEKQKRLAQKREEKEHKEISRDEKKRKINRKSKDKKNELPISQGLKLKARLNKIHKKKYINGQVTARENMAFAHQLASEKWDLEFIKREKMQREVSLADQILAAKNKRAESAASELQISSLSSFQYAVRARRLT